jgi:prepilin-type N-terminal cleavage/methylation domain-containing protein
MKKVRLGFTLIELLVVISIIGILAGILLPSLARAKEKARIAQVRTDIKGFEGAITAYQSDYQRFPTSKAVRTDGVSTKAPFQNPDYTYGTHGTTAQGQADYVTKNGKRTTIAQPATGVQTNNSEVVGILMDIKDWNARAKGNPDNRKGTPYLNVKFSDLNLAGVGRDGVFRDPWGSPYIVSMDLDFSGTTRDALYRGTTVSQDAKDPTKGLNGLFSAGKDAYEARNAIMIWSFGPDRQASQNEKANLGVNKDNILSWQ